MNATNAFFIWFFQGLNTLGGWFLFFLFALISVIWLFYHSSQHKIPASGWRLGSVILAALLLPAIIYRFSSLETRMSLDPFVEAIFYLGLLAGILPPILAIGYYVTNRGLKGCPNGHVYDAALGQCPECNRNVVVNVPAPVRRSTPEFQGPTNFVQEPLAPKKAKSNAFLVTQDGRNYQLNKGETTIGRAPSNDIQFSGETSVSRQHAKIFEENGRFYLSDLASTSGTRINHQIIRQRTLLEPDDEIQFGEKVITRFLTSRR